MELDFSTELRDHRNKPVMYTENTPATLQDIVIDALANPSIKRGGKESVDVFKLILRISNALGAVEVTAEEVAQIKKAVEDTQSSYITAIAWMAIEEQ